MSVEFEDAVEDDDDEEATATGPSFNVSDAVAAEEVGDKVES